MAVITNQTTVAYTPEELFDYCVRVDAHPRGWFRLMFPLFMWMTRRQEKATMTQPRQAVERRAGRVAERSDR